MLKILTVIFFLLARSAAAADFDKPGKFGYEGFVNQFQHAHLINMTESLCKDALYKLRMADVVQDTYRSTHGYELGIIAANLMEKFRHMIRIYRYYSVHRSFKNTDHLIQQIMNAYSSMQSYYNELVAETVLFYKVLESHVEKDAAEYAEAKRLAKKHKMSVDTIRDLQKKGIKLSELGLSRRSVKTGSEPPDYGENPLEGKGVRQLLLEDPMAKNINTWTPKRKENNTQEEAYKKKLRYTMWAKKWNGFDGETEGVNIAATVAKLGLTNDSDFLLKELKGAL